MDYRELKKWQQLPCLHSLLDLSTPPKKLFYTGRWNSKILENAVAVVGSRRITDYGTRVVEKVVRSLISQGQTVISGFMYGVDQDAHQVCVDMGGKTIAVLGWGIDTKLTGADLKLAEKIISSGGLILSEWESQPPSHWTFPARNRIVAALCKEVIIVEAAEKSGSLITARIANNLKRTVWAVPGPITSRTSLGTNNLIAAGKARVWLGTITPAPASDDPILQILDQQTQTADELARNLKLPISEVGAQLSILLLSGQVKEIGGKYYIDDAS